MNKVDNTKSESISKKEIEYMLLSIRYEEDIRNTKIKINEEKNRLKLLKEDKKRLAGALAVLNEIKQTL
jgi:hypothetical protein